MRDYINNELKRIGFKKEKDMYYRRLDENLSYYITLKEDSDIVKLEATNVGVLIHEDLIKIEDFCNKLKSGISVYTMFLHSKKGAHLLW